ncbi:glycosyltransferase family 1 protein [bacterium]|nr:glycosyltransferase family 1 protein [bacterium]
MADFVWVTWDGAGNLPPQRALARALLARGHRLRALAHDSLREALTGDGAECLPVPGLRRYDAHLAMQPAEELGYVLEHVWYARSFGEALLSAVADRRPDGLLVDLCLTHALVAAHRTGLPTTALGHFPYQILLGPFAPVTASRLDETNAYAAELGVAPFASHQALVEAAALVLVPTYRSFDEVDDPAPHVVHVGPCRAGHEAAAPWQRRAPDRPLVLVGLSTSNQMQQPLLQRLCDALAPLAVEAVVTSGPAIDPQALRPGDNTSVVRFVAHDLILPATDLLITHAGHGTALAGATYGVPMLCFPMGRDQPLIADRVARLGLGAVLPPDAEVAAIRDAIAGMLADPALRERARAYARSVADHPDLAEAVRRVESHLAAPR